MLSTGSVADPGNLLSFELFIALTVVNLLRLMRMTEKMFELRVGACGISKALSPKS